MRNQGECLHGAPIGVICGHCHPFQSKAQPRVAKCPNCGWPKREMLCESDRIAHREGWCRE